VIEPLCASSSAPTGSTLDTVEPIGSYALPNVPGKRVTIVRVFYGPGGFTRAHRHAGSVTAYITKGEIRSQLGAVRSRPSRSASRSSSRRVPPTWSRRMPATPNPRS
jgi:quercetin dioxygenase-like cupin family protein